MEAFHGTWRNKKVTDDSMETLLDAINCSAEQRKLYNERTYECTIAKGDTDKMLEISLMDSNTSKTIHYELVLDQVTEHLDIDGHMRKILTTWDGKELHEKYINTEGEFINHRKINANGNMLTTTSYNGTSFSFEWVKC